MNQNEAEAKEHTPGRLNELFTDPYRAFENDTDERQLHIRIMLHMLLARPMKRDQMTLRVIHGWENGGFEPEDLQHVDYALGGVPDFKRAVQDFEQASKHNTPLPADKNAILAAPLADAIADAKAEGQDLNNDIRDTPARWPAFEGGLALYTLFKMYHRLIYGEDDTYRCTQCMTPLGMREIHEFHLEEGEFALLVPPAEHFMEGESLLVLHESQLGPIEQLLEESLPLFDNF
ncbi:hypothetical protein ACFIOZ_15260 [Vreelandella sp. F11]|jgi:hypothetical protein|uniref:Uncharacterized protein n=1 Tax=Halomonas campaniensis TaxID=213554 RepID=A0A246S2T8_9GAMM|nr:MULTISPECIES: hypothetical protein [Halomonas]MBS3669491.1 hypothetical protein [Halomonas boliviensis]OWV30738.1 hypothetical protein JI62_05410 [Halomonas campaniensis]